MNEEKWKKGGETTGTCLQGYLDTSYAKLHAILGEPEADDGYKVSTRWTITLADGRVATIYDYKETYLYDRDLPMVGAFRALPVYGWHIGGFAGGQGLADDVAKALGLP